MIHVALPSGVGYLCPAVLAAGCWAVYASSCFMPGARIKGGCFHDIQAAAARMFRAASLTPADAVNLFPRRVRTVVL